MSWDQELDEFKRNIDLREYAASQGYSLVGRASGRGAGPSLPPRGRKIPVAILASDRFAGRVRIDERNNAIFPHFDAKVLCRFEMKNKGFTGFSTGGTKGLWLTMPLTAICA